jgi:hypothetical protein
MVGNEDQEPRQRETEVGGVVAVQCGLGSRVGESTTRLTIVLQVGVRGCGPPSYAGIESEVEEHEAKCASAALGKRVMVLCKGMC